MSFLCRTRITTLTLVLLWAAFLAGLPAVRAQQQLPPPPGGTFSCSPNPVYDYAPTTCSMQWGGNATGTVTVYFNAQEGGQVQLDSNGYASFVVPAGTFDWNGVFRVDANYPGNGQYGPADITTVYTFTTTPPVVTAQTLTCSPYQLYAGQSTTCTFSSPASGITGNVVFTVDGTAWQTVALDSTGTAVATSGLSGLGAGNHQVQAVYQGNSNYAGFPTTFAVDISNTKPLPSQITVACTPAPVTQSATGSCQVQVGGGATGTVSLYVNNQVVAQNVALAAGNTVSTATIPDLFQALQAGIATVSAVYSGDNNFASATAGTSVNIVNGQSTSTMAVTCTPAGLIPGQSGSCAAQLPGGATGNVSFLVDGTAWTSAAINASGLATTPRGLQTLAPGTHSIVATYPGDDNFDADQASSSLTVSSSPGLSANETFSCSPATIVQGGSTTCYASLGSGPTGAVIITQNSYYSFGMGLDANGTAIAENVLAGYGPGTYQLAADYMGDLNYQPATSTFTVQIVSQQQSQSLTATTSPTSVVNGGQLSLLTAVAPGATGAVTVTVNGVQLTQLQLNANGKGSGLVNFTGSSGPGSYTLTFTYPGDANFAQATQTATVTVTAPTSSPPPSCPVNP